MGFLFGGQRQYPQNPYYQHQQYMPYPSQHPMQSQAYGPPSAMTGYPQIGLPTQPPLGGHNQQQHYAVPDPYGYQYDHGSYGYQQQPQWNYYQYNPYHQMPHQMPLQHPFYYEETEAIPVHATATPAPSSTD